MAAFGRILIAADNLFGGAQFRLGLATMARHPGERVQGVVDAQPAEQIALLARIVGLRPIDFTEIAVRYRQHPAAEPWVRFEVEHRQIFHDHPRRGAPASPSAIDSRLA